MCSLDTGGWGGGDLGSPASQLQGMAGWRQLPVGRHGGPGRRSRPQEWPGRVHGLPSPSSHRQVCEEFRSISRKIYEKPNSIEELAELREWMKGIPEKLVGLEVRRV